MPEKFTSGPYTYGESCEDGQPVIYIEAGGRILATVHASYGYANQRTNARLFAAAPDLFAACEDVCETCAWREGRGDCKNCKVSDAFKKVRGES